MALGCNASPTPPGALGRLGHKDGDQVVVGRGQRCPNAPGHSRGVGWEGDTVSKGRHVVYLSAATATALADYRARRGAAFRSTSEAVEHLLRRALTGELDEGLEGLLLPHIERAVRAAVREEVGELVGQQIERQSNRLAALLVASGKDAYRAAALAQADLEQRAGKRQAEAIARDVDLGAGARYSRQGVRGAGD